MVAMAGPRILINQWASGGTGCPGRRGFVVGSAVVAIGARVLLCGLLGALAGCGVEVGGTECSTDCSESSEGTESSGGVAPTSGGEVGTSGESSGWEETSGGTTGEPGCPAAWADDLAFGPGPVDLAEGTAVAIDIVDLRGRFVVDVAGETTVATAELTFRVGEVAGRPIFDLRQEFTEGELDGESVAGEDLWTRDLGGGLGAEMRVLDRELPACSEHQLIIKNYPLVRPPGIAADPPSFDEDGVVWDFAFSDLVPRMYLEQWLPANLMHDRHPIALRLEIVGGMADQRVLTNGEMSERGGGVWEIAFPARSTAVSPMLVLAPGNAVVSASSEVAGIPVEVHRLATVAEDVPGLQATIEAALAEYVDSIGGYTHSRFTAIINNNAGMEYDGGTTTDPLALQHEVFHSWFGRSVQPMRAMDGWFDEAWDDYNTGDPKLPATPKDVDDPRFALCDGEPWGRTTPIQAYAEGKAVFAGIAAQAGVEPLRASMREFYVKHMGERVTTEMLEMHLHCGLPTAEVRLLFHRFVYGKSGDPPALPDDVCDG